MLMKEFARKCGKSIYANRNFAVVGILVTGLVGVSSPAQAAEDPRYTRRILTKTVYFNHAETRRMAISADEAYAFGSTLRHPYSGIVTGFSGQVSYFAARVDAAGYCVSLRSTGSLRYYSGSAGGGYCR